MTFGTTLVAILTVLFQGYCRGVLVRLLRFPAVPEPGKKKHLLSLHNCSRFSCRFALVHTHYKLIQLTYTSSAAGF